MTFFEGQTQEQQTGQQLASDQYNNENQGRRLKLIQAAAPLFSQKEAQESAMNLASSNMDDSTMVKEAQRVAGAALVGSYKSHLESITDPWKQLQTYKQFDPGQRKLLEKAGYVVPQAEEPDITEFGIVKKMAGGLAHDVSRILGVKETLKGLDYLGGIGTHVYRDLRLGLEEEGVFGIGGSLPDEELAARRKSVRAVAGDFANLWNRSADGEKLFSVKSQQRIHNGIPDEDKFNFVKALAEGMTPYDYIKDELSIDPGTPLFDTEVTKYAQYQGQDDVINAVKELKNNRYSPGRDLASLMNFDRGTLGGNIVGGGLDATFRVLTDPLLYGGKAIKAFEAGAYGLDAAIKAAGATESLVESGRIMATRIDELRTVPRFSRAAEQIAMRTREGNAAVLLDELPQMRGGGLEDFSKWMAHSGIAEDAVTPDHVFDYFKSTAGTEALGAGKFAAPHFPGTILPSLSKPESFRRGLVIGIKGWNEQFRLAEYGFDALTPKQLQELFGLKTRIGMNVQRGVGNAIHSFYTKVPKYDFMGPEDDNALEQFRAVLDYSLPNSMRDDFVNDWIKAGTGSDVYGARRAIYESGVESMFHYSGALQTDEGKKIMQKVLGRKQVYGGYGIDRMAGKGGRSIGIGEADMADAWAIPDFREMLQATQSNTYLRKVLDHTNDGMINRFMATYWKPAVLLKAGFIPRAYGEEMLGFILREGPKAWWNSQLAITATKEGHLLPLRPVGWIADSLLSHVPHVPGVDTPVDILAKNAAGHVTSVVRNWAERKAPDEYLTAVKNLMRYGADSPHVRAIGTVYGEMRPPPGQRMMQEWIHGEDPETGELMRLEVKHGEFRLHNLHDPYFRHTVVREVKRLQSDRLFSPLIDAGSRIFQPDELEGIVGHLTDHGLVQGGDTATGKLLNIRNSVPDKVMGKWESWLKNTSFASRDAVHEELVQNGMDPAHAEQLMNAAHGLEPRQRVAIFTRDGELERMSQAHTLDADAQWDYNSDIPFVRSEVENTVRKEHERMLEALWSGDQVDIYDKIAAKRLRMADMRSTVKRSYRSRELRDGTVVANAPQRGSRRVYTLMVDSNPVSQFEEVPLVASSNRAIDRAAGYIPLQSGEVNKLIPDHMPGNTLVDVGQGEQALPDELAWFTEDFSHAKDIHETLSVKYKGQHVSIGYVDVPEDVYQSGRAKATEAAAGGLDPMAIKNQANQVVLPKTWRDNYMALDNDYKLVSQDLELAQSKLDDVREGMAEEIRQYGMASPESKEALTKARDDIKDIKSQLNDGRLKFDASVGTTGENAIDDWANVIAQKYRQMFHQSDSYAMRDVQHQVKTGVLGVNHLDNLAESQLPDQVVGPALLQAKDPTMFHSLVQRGFDAVGRGGDAMVRNQMFLHYYTKRLEQQAARMTQLLGHAGSNKVIEEIAGQLGTTPYQLSMDWNDLPDDIRGATNPYQAMINRDPIPDSLRVIDDPNDAKSFAEAWTALYENDNPDLIEEAEKTWDTKYAKTGKAGDVTFNMAQDGYLSMHPELRGVVRNHGIPDQIPSAFRGPAPVAEQVARKELVIGAAVQSPDRGNWGIVDQINDDGTATVTFTNPESGAFRTVDFPADELKTQTEGRTLADVIGSKAVPALELEVTSKPLAEVKPGDRIRLPGGKFKTMDRLVDFSDEAGPIGQELTQSELEALSANRRLFVKWDDGTLSNHWPAELEVEIQSPAAARAAEKAEAPIRAIDDQIAQMRSHINNLTAEAGEGLGIDHPDVVSAKARLDALTVRKEVLLQGPSVAKTGADLSIEEWTSLRDALNTNRHIWKTTHDIAMKGAIEDTIPWVDDHRVRSQFQQHGRNLFPFWFAQENFIKRTATNLMRDPAAIRKAQLLMAGLHNSGVVMQNQYGEDIYNIPFTGALTKTVGKLFDILPGTFSIPTVNPMTGQLKYTIPGLDTFDRIGPSFSPVIGLPLQVAAKLFPELEGAKQAILGERGTTSENGLRLIAKAILPSYAQRIWQGLVRDPDSDSEYMSAMIQTAQMLEAAGHGLPENAEEYQFRDWQKRLENHTRMQFILRGIVGFFSPAAPSTNPVEELTPEFQELLKEMPLENAQLEFMTRHPDARAYTIFKTSVESNAPLAASDEAGKVLNDHEEYFNKYSKAGPWLLPQADDETGFSNSTYNLQIADGLRERKSLKEWYDDYYFAAGAKEYFDSKDRYDEKMLAYKGNAQMRRDLTDSYQTWKDGYLKQHKIFAKLINSSDAQNRRHEILDQMDAALSDPNAPDAVHKEALGTLVGSYKKYLEQKKVYRGNTNAEKAIKQNLTDSFTLWLHQHVAANPGVQAFYDRVIRPEMGIED